jgi:hypothetical protein
VPRAVAAGVLACAAVAGAATSPAAPAVVRAGAARPAQTANVSPAPAGVHLAYQDPWIARGGSFTMLLRVDDAALAARPGAAIAVTIHESVTTRTAFDLVIAEDDPGATLYTLSPLPIASLPRLGGNLAVRIGLAGSGVRPAVNLDRRGVYPVRVSLTNTGTPTGSFVTWLVVVDDAARPIDQPLMVAWVWPLLAPPALTPEGSLDPDVASQLRAGGRLDRIAAVLAGAGRLPLSLLVGPETVASWAQLADREPRAARSLARLRAAARRSTTDVLPAMYVPVDVAAMVSAGLGERAAAQLDAGSRTLADVLGAAPFDGAPAAFVDPASDAAIRHMLATRVAVRESALAPATHQFTPAQSFSLVTGGGTVQGVATAPFAERLLLGPDPGALKAQRLVAALAEVAYEAPAVARGIVLAPASEWSPDPETLNPVIAALRDFPLATPVTLRELFARISVETLRDVPLQRILAPAAPTALPVGADDYRATADRLAAYAAVVGAQDRAVVEGERALLVALSSSISPARAQALLARIDSSIQAFSDAVRVDAKRITLTARRASVPLSFHNNLSPARPVTVRVHLVSEKLLFPQGAERIVRLDPGVNTMSFTVEARASGTFPMTITLTSEDGRLRFGPPVRVTVRSAVFGGFAVALTAGAVVFLAAWWANHLRRARRARRLAARASGAAP